MLEMVLTFEVSRCKKKANSQRREPQYWVHSIHLTPETGSMSTNLSVIN